MKNGFGVFKWPEGDIYEGNFKDDISHGYGEMTLADGTTKSGHWIQGEYQGNLANKQVIVK